MTITVTEPELTIIKTILRQHLTDNDLVYVFGSRAKGSPKKYSDLDLAIDACGKKLSFTILTTLSSDFEESDLPYKVDIVDLITTNPEFCQIIKNEAQLLDFK